MRYIIPLLFVLAFTATGCKHKQHYVFNGPVMHKMHERRSPAAYSPQQRAQSNNQPACACPY